MGRWMESGTLELNNGQTWKYKLQRLKDKKVKKNVWGKVLNMVRISETEEIEYIQKRFELGKIQASALFYELKSYFIRNTKGE